MQWSIYNQEICIVLCVIMKIVSKGKSYNCIQVRVISLTVRSLCLTIYFYIKTA